MLRFSVVVFVGLRYPTNNNITVATGVSTINLATDSCTMEALYHKHVHLSTHTHTYLHLHLHLHFIPYNAASANNLSKSSWLLPGDFQQPVRPHTSPAGRSPERLSLVKPPTSHLGKFEFSFTNLKLADI